MATTTRAVYDALVTPPANQAYDTAGSIIANVAGLPTTVEFFPLSSVLSLPNPTLITLRAKVSLTSLPSPFIASLTFYTQLAGQWVAKLPASTVTAILTGAQPTDDSSLIASSSISSTTFSTSTTLPIVTPTTSPPSTTTPPNVLITTSTPVTTPTSYVSPAAPTSPYTASVVPTTVLSSILTTSTYSSTATSAASPTTPSTFSNTSSSPSVETNLTTSTIATQPASLQTNAGAVASSSGKYSTPELVGIAVGCFVAGVLIAGILALLFLRRRRPRPDDDHSIVHEKEMSPSSDYGDAVYVRTDTPKAWDQRVVPAESDHTIRNAATAMLNHIEHYVNTFYDDTQSTTQTMRGQADLAALESDHLPEPVMTLLLKSDKPTVLIKHCIAEQIISSITSGESSVSFLPKDYTTLSVSTTQKNKPDFGHALSQWRILTSYLRQSPENDVVYHADRDRNITTTAQRLCRAFEPWAHNNDTLRLKNMVDIMKRASRFGIVLFSQPASFHWRWSSDSYNGITKTKLDGDQVVMFPGLEKVTNEDETSSQPYLPLRLLEPRVRSLYNT